MGTAGPLQTNCRLLSSSGYWILLRWAEVGVNLELERSCRSRTCNRRDLASTCVLRPCLEELVSLNFRGTELQSRRRIGLRSELQYTNWGTTEVELRFIYAKGKEGHSMKLSHR